MLVIARVAFVACLIACIVSPAAAVAGVSDDDFKAVVSQTIRPVMKRYGVAGVAVGVTIGGRHYVFNCGLASKAMSKPVDGDTLFEIGSISKTFTASLVSYAQVIGKLQLSDTVSADLPALRGTSFDRVRLLNLGTYTAGGLPLQFPDDVRTDADALTYYGRWKPAHEPGKFRLYSNPSIMLLGLIAAKRLDAGFISLMQRDLFAPVGLNDTYLVVPKDRLSHYAQGYTEEDKPRRMAPGPLAPEAYGIRTTAGDMLRFIDANIGLLRLGDPLDRAIRATHTGYYRLGAMTQDLIWEQYRYPSSLSRLLQGNSDQVIFDENRVTALTPPLQSNSDVLIDKTGSTSGFGAYVAFVPLRKTGIVLLANKSYPIAARVSAAYRILTRLMAMMAQPSRRLPDSAR